MDRAKEGYKFVKRGSVSILCSLQLRLTQFNSKSVQLFFSLIFSKFFCQANDQAYFIRTILDYVCLGTEVPRLSAGSSHGPTICWYDLISYASECLFKQLTHELFMSKWYTVTLTMLSL